MDSPAGFSDTGMDQDDIPYPCKGCGEVCTTVYLLRDCLSDHLLLLCCYRSWRKEKHLNWVSS